MTSENPQFRFRRKPLYAAVLANVVALGTTVHVSAGPKNPCAVRNPSAAALQLAAANPCAASPCAAKNPCNPCAANPCNPCAANPCGATALDAALINRPEGTSLMAGDPKELLQEGETLWKDTQLSSNGMACETCHSNNQSFMATFAQPYPHPVAMSQAMAGMSEIDLDEMVQICMVVPMAAAPLGWESRELAALTAYTAIVQQSYQDMVAANPCAAQKAGNPCNPCAAANPCNPCATKNPCAAENPCAANPCAAKNPCSG